MTEKLMTLAADLFEIVRQDDTIIITPVVDLRECNFERIETSASDIMDVLDGSGVKNVILDFAKTDYYGSTALSFFVKLWMRIRRQGGRMAFCNVSAHEKEILEITHLDHLWPVCGSRQEALEAVQNRATTKPK